MILFLEKRSKLREFKCVFKMNLIQKNKYIYLNIKP